MKIFTNQKIWKKLVIVLLIIMCFQFFISTPVRADSDGIGGKLLEPVIDLVVFLGDRNYKCYS
jgi:hypothetical protein